MNHYILYQEFQILKAEYERAGFELLRIGSYEFRLCKSNVIYSLKLLYHFNLREWRIEYQGRKTDTPYLLAKGILNKIIKNGEVLIG